MPDGQTRRRSQREIRQGKAPRRLAERGMHEHSRLASARGGRAYLTRQLALAVTVLFLVIAATVVHGDDYSSIGYSPPSGPYVGAGWGRFDLHLHNLDEVGTAITDITHSNDDAWKAFVGFRFAPFIGVEAAYIDFGHPKDRFSTFGSDGVYHVTMTGFSPAAILTLPLGAAEIFGKAGYYFYNLDTRVDFSSGPFVESKHSRSDFIFGGGLGVTLFRHLNLRAEYERINVRNASGSDVIWLSPSWRF
jgi:hypothetical protein